MHHEKIVLTIPAGTYVAVEETTGSFLTSYAWDGSQNYHSGNATSDTLNDDSSLEFVNEFPAVAPTGLTLTLAPFLLMALAGMLLALIAFGRRRREEND